MGILCRSRFPSSWPTPPHPRNHKRKGNLAFNCVGYEKGHEELKFRVDQVSQEKEEEEL